MMRLRLRPIRSRKH